MIVIVSAWCLTGFVIALFKLGRNNNPDGLAALALMTVIGPFGLLL